MNRSPHAFSLIELLVVVAIVVLLMVMLVPAFNNLGKAQLLSAEGNKIVNLVNLAGQNSAAKNAMTALIAIPGNSTRPGGFGLFEYLPEGAGWKQISQWESLKNGIIFDYPNTNYKFSEYPASSPYPDFPTITYRGEDVSSFQYLVFLPSRSLLQATSAQLRLVEGFFAAGATNPTFTRPGDYNGAANFYAVTVLGTSGRPKIDQP